MEYAKLGKSGIEVSRLCVGCMSFGRPSEDFHEWTLNPNETEEIVKKALDLGINFFDTANTYSHGTSEEYLGRLGTDYVDLYIIHRFDYTTPIEETMEALHGLVKAGKVRALGASAMYGYQFMKMQYAAERNGWTKFVSMQNHYNLLYREDERELIPICNEMGIARTPYSPLAAGHLSRPVWNSESRRSATDKMAAQKYNATEEVDMKIVDCVAALAAEKNCTMTQIALAWQFAKGVTAPIIGGTKAKYFEDATGAFEVRLTKEDITRLEAHYIPHKVVGAL